MRSNLTDELAEFRREVKAVIDTALSETDAPLAVGDLKRGAGLSPQPMGFIKSAESCRVCKAGGNEMSIVDRELGLLEQSNAALFAALAQSRAKPVRALPPAVDARLIPSEARRVGSDGVVALRLREVAEMEWREQRRKQEKRRLLERTKDLRHVVSDLERQKMELIQKLDDKRQRRERREAEARRREGKRRDEEARLLREQAGMAAREADRLRVKVKGQAAQAVRMRAREALWRWRASAAASVAARERRGHRSAQLTVATTAQQAVPRGSRATRREVELEHDHDEVRRVTDSTARYEQRSSRSAMHRTAGRDEEWGSAERMPRVSAPVPRTAMAQPYYSQDFTEVHRGARALTETGSMGDIVAARYERGNAGCGGLPSPVDYERQAHADSSDEQLARLVGERRVHQQRVEHVEAATAVMQAAEERHRMDYEHPRSERMGHSARGRQVKRLESARAFVQSLALILRAGRRAREKRRLGKALFALKEEAVAARVARDRKAAQRAREVAAREAAISAGAAVTTAVLGRVRRQAVDRAFRIWQQACREATRKDEMRQTTFGRVLARAERRHRAVRLNALQRWRLCAATAAMEALLKRQCREKVQRGFVLLEAFLRRQGRARLVTGFQRWRKTDSELLRARVAAATLRHHRAAAVKVIATMLHRRRRDGLRQALGAWGAATRSAAERGRREQGARVLAARKERAARLLLLTKSFGCWKAFAAASRSSRRLQAVAQEARRFEMEKRRLSMGRLALACRAAVTAAESRRKARAWSVWRRNQGLDRELAFQERVGAQSWRQSRLRLGLQRWRDRYLDARAKRLLRSRVSKLRSVAELLGTMRTPMMDVSRAFRAWARAAAAEKVAALQKRQGARIIVRMLRVSRRDALGHAMEKWRSAAARRLRNAKRLQGVVVRTLERRRLFLLSKVWSKLMRCAGEREALRARKLGAVRALHALLASATRASRRGAFLRWRSAAVEGAAASRLHLARCAALERCWRIARVRELCMVWATLRTRAKSSRVLATVMTGLEGKVQRAQLRALSRRFGTWRSVALAGAIAAVEQRAAGEHRNAAVRVLVGAAARVEQRRMASGLRALTTFAAGCKRAKTERDLRLRRAFALLHGTLGRANRRKLRQSWKTWMELVVENRLRGAIGAATSHLEGERNALVAELMALKQRAAMRLLSSFVERSNRLRIQRGWNVLRFAARRKSLLARAIGNLDRSRLHLLGLSLHHWRKATAQASAIQVRVGTERALMASCMAGAPWSKVANSHNEEDEIRVHDVSLLRFAALLAEAGTRLERARKRRAFTMWEVGIAKRAAITARVRAVMRTDLARAVGGEEMGPPPAEVDCHKAGARLVARWLSRRQLIRQLAAWRRWTAVASAQRVVKEREVWRMRGVMHLARELAHVIEARRHRVLRRSLGVWRQGARGLADHSATVAQQVSRKRAGVRRLHAVIERNLLRRKARVWARLLGSAVATCERLQRDRDSEAQREHLLVVAKARSARRKLSIVWSAWKDTWVTGRHRGEVGALRAQRGAASVAMVTRQKELEAQRRALMLWRVQARHARQKERAMSRIAACLLRAEARSQRTQIVRSFVGWRVWCARHGRVLAEANMAYTEAAFGAQAILVILERQRLRRLGEGFRRLIEHKASAIYWAQQKQAHREDLSRALRGLGRMVTRGKQKHLIRAFARWRCFAAEVGQQSDRALFISARRRAGAQVLCAIVSHHENCTLSRAWGLWRSGAASAAVHDGERASADLRVAGARHSAGARLLLMTLAGVRRRALLRAWGIWCREARAAADAELQIMEKHFHLARTLIRVERRAEQARMGRAWRAWVKHVRVVASLTRATRAVRKGLLAQSVSRWQLASHRQKQAEADEARVSAESALRARALMILVQRHRLRQLRQAFYALFDHGAWAIYGDRQQAARLDRTSRGLGMLTRVCARRRERSKLAALTGWRRFAADRRRCDDRALLQATGRRAGAKALLSLVARRENLSIARAWSVWRTGAASAAVHEDERASADRRVFGARRSAGTRLLVGVLTGMTRRTLTRAWGAWCKEAKAAADAELQVMEKHYHLARTLTRVEKRRHLMRLDRAWRTWSEVVRTVGEAEVQALERHFHVAQVVTRVVRRVQERRLLRAWALWARQAARGRPRNTASVVALPPDLLRSSRGSASAARVPATTMGTALARGLGAPEQREEAEHSCRVRCKAAVVAVRGILRRASARALSHSWRAWRAMVATRAGQEARATIGAMRLTSLLPAAMDRHEASCIRRSWGRLIEWSATEGRRFRQAAEAEARELRAGEAKGALAAVLRDWEARVLRCHFTVWMEAAATKIRTAHGVESGEHSSFQGTDETTGFRMADAPTLELLKTGLGHASSEELGTEANALASGSQSSALSALRHKLRSDCVRPADSPSASWAPTSGGKAPAITASSPHSSTIISSSPLSSQKQNGFKLSTASQVGENGFGHVKAPSPRGNGEISQDSTLSGDSSVLSMLHLAGSGRSSPGFVVAARLQSPETSGIDEAGSLEFSASTEGTSAGIDSRNFALYSAGINTSSLLESTNAAMVSVMTMTNGSPSDSLAYASESPLFGESVLRAQSDGVVSFEDGLPIVNIQDRDLSLVNGHGGSGDGVDAVAVNYMDKPRSRSGSESLSSTPRRSRSRSRASSFADGGNGSTRKRDLFRGKSPPYVPGSVHASPSKPLSPSEDQMHDADADPLFVLTNGLPYVESEPSDDYVDTRNSVVEAFVSKIQSILWRRALKRWVRVHRAIVYELRMQDAMRRVAFLRRQQKLRKVVVSALRRQSYAWHLNDNSRAMRKWKEFVRRHRDDERLSLEVSRISMFSASSPMTPRSARAHTTGLLEASLVSDSEVTSSARGEAVVLGEHGHRQSSHRSPFSPAINSARRLWDKVD